MTDINKLKKKKKIYLILMIVVGLLLIADIVAFATIGRSRGRKSFNGGNFPANFDTSNMPEGFDSSNMPEGFTPGSMPEGFDASNMPEGFDASNMPEDFSPGNMPAGFGQSADEASTESGSSANGEASTESGSSADGEASTESGSSADGEASTESTSKGPGNMPGNFDPGNMPGRGPGNVLSIVFIAVGIVLLIVEIIFTALFFITLKKIRNFNEGDGDGTGSNGGEAEKEIIDPAELRKKKQKKDRITLGAVIAIALVVVLVLATLSNNVKDTQSVAVEESVLNATADSGSVSKSIKGSGVIAATDEEDVSIAGNISVTKYYVSDGDAVSEGDIIAAVDMNSVKAAIGDIESTMEKIDEEMMSVKDKSVSSSVTAPSDARIVKIYAESDVDVVDVMYENGSLMVLSLDGTLAVDIENTGDLNMDTEVTVVDEDGNEYTGYVAAVQKETLTVKVSMDDFSFGEKVTVRNKETGAELAKGELYVADELDITGYSGTIDSIKVSENEKVEEGDTLITLENTDYTASYKMLLEKRAILEAQYNTLVEIANTGYLYATSDGTISGVDTALVIGDTSDDESAGEAAEETTGDGSEEAKASVEANENNLVTAADGEAVETTSRSVSIIWLDSKGQITDQNLPAVTVELKYGETVVSTVTLSSETGYDYTWENLAKYDGDSEIPYTVSEAAVEGYTASSKVSGLATTIINTPAQAAAAAGAGDSATPAAGVGDSGTTAPGNGQDAGNSAQAGSDAGNSTPSGNDTSAGISSSSGFDASGIAGGNFDTSSITADANQQNTENSDTYTVDETVICQLTPNDQVSISVTIDELDINKVSVGQECQVTLDAITGQSYTGKIMRRDSSGENDGGNTKYTVTVNMDKTENMLLGMNASVSIPLETKDNILVIPEEALVEQDGSVYVYTEYNEKKDELSGLTEIKTGASDGINVEITEGIDAGTKVYYRYAGTILYTF